MLFRSIGIWNDVISKSTNTENIGEAAEVQSVEVVNTVVAAPEVIEEAAPEVIEEAVIEVRKLK